MPARELQRSAHVREVRSLLRAFPVVALVGARQVGKTTLARRLLRAGAHGGAWFDLESDEDLGRLADPLLALRSHRGLVVLDEIQRRPDLFRALRVLVDEPGERREGRRFLVLGSASGALLRQSAESLAGRVAYHELTGFSVREVGQESREKLWRRGGFPRSFLARSEAESLRWRQELVRTYLERDLPALGLRLPAPTMRRFWMMLAHYHGQVWNASELARSFGVAHTTVQRYLDVLSETFMVRQLPPWHENVGKRQVKSPKVYLADAGILHALLGLGTATALESHPKVGASWEGFVLEEVIQRLGARREECFFWSTHGGAELDLLVVRGGRRWGFEIKRSSAPVVTRSMHVARADLGLAELCVVHAGRSSFPMAPGIRAVAFERLDEDVQPVG